MNKKILSFDSNKLFISKLLIILWFAVLAYLLFSIINIIFILLFSIFIVVLFSPFLNFLNRYKINDFFWMIIIFFIISLLIFVFLFSVIPLVANQVSWFFDYLSKSINWWLSIYNDSGVSWFWLPVYVENIISKIEIEQVLNSLKDNISQISKFFGDNLSWLISSWAWIITWVTSVLFNLVMVFIFTFFISLERKSIRKFFYKIIPYDFSKYLLNNEKDVVSTLGEWFKWQIIISIAMFFITLISLFILKLFWIEIEWIFTLALIAWFMEFIPYIWTFISLAIALLVWLWAWVEWFFAILIVYLIIQQVEWNILIPYIMWKTLSLSPFTVLISMTIWASLFGIIWIIFSVPAAAVIQVFLWKYLETKKTIIK